MRLLLELAPVKISLMLGRQPPRVAMTFLPHRSSFKERLTLAIKLSSRSALRRPPTFSPEPLDLVPGPKIADADSENLITTTVSLDEFCIFWHG